MLGRLKGDSELHHRFTYALRSIEREFDHSTGRRHLLRLRKGDSNGQHVTGSNADYLATTNPVGDPFKESIFEYFSFS
jgi:hypothetical protein